MCILPRGCSAAWLRFAGFAMAILTLDTGSDMIIAKDLDAAVAAGILDQEQAQRLGAFLAGRADDPALASASSSFAHEERFRFLNGFNDVFLTAGVALVAAALFSLFGSNSPGIALAGPVILWLISEVLVGRMRAVLPGIFLSMAWAYICAEGTFALLQKLGSQHQTIVLISAVVASLLYYARFRLPFTLGQIAGLLAFSASTSFAFEASSFSTPVIFASGLITFAAAMAYDVRDPERTTRLADCGFWLHLAAAPMIVHPIVSSLKGNLLEFGHGTAVSILAAIAALGLIALIIDRRALLASSLIYFVAAIGYLLKSGGSSLQDTTAASLGVAGLFVLLLGVFWQPVRRAVMYPLSGLPITKFLPPAT